MPDDLPDQDQSEEVVRIKVLEAHKILMGLNDPIAKRSMIW
jgi:hypothetical protein